MAGRDEYLLRAAELNAMGQVEKDPAEKLEFENLARAYLRLAKQAERNSQIEIVLRDAARKRGVTEPNRCRGTTMSSPAEVYRQNAAGCEQWAERATVTLAKNTFRGLAEQWLRLAALVEGVKKRVSGTE